MQSRIDQMLAAWNNLDLLKSVRLERHPDYSSAGMENLPSPAIDKLPALPIVRPVYRSGTPGSAELFCGKSVVVKDNVLPYNAEPAARISPLQSAPPRLTSNRLTKISSSSVELPELPVHLVQDDGVPSQSSSPATSPRSADPSSSGRGLNMKRLRKKASKRLSKFAIDLSEIAQKMSPRSGRNSPEKTSPVRKPSPQKDDPRLSSIPFNERNRIAAEMAVMCMTDEYKKATETRQSLLFNGKLIGLLDTYPELVNPAILKALRADLEWRMQNSVVDKVVAMDDPQFIDFFKKAADGNFMKPWVHDTADATDPATGKKKKNADRLRPTFVRDFENSSYYAKNANGELIRLDSTDQFIEFIDPENDSSLSSIVSNIASQNLGNFLKNILFLRHDGNRESQSLLRLHDGTPVMPLAVAKASYVFCRDARGKITLDYTWHSSKEHNGGKPLRVKRMTGDNSQAEVENASLGIEVRIEIEPDGQWTISNPRLQAKGWNVPVDR